MFPETYFIIIKRHPVPVSYATRKWWRWYIFTWRSLIKHWVAAYEIFNNDRKFLKNCMEIKYEDFTKQPKNMLDNISSFLEIKKFDNKVNIRSDINQKYFDRWRRDFRRKLFRNNWQKIVKDYESRVNRLGYSLLDQE